MLLRRILPVVVSVALLAVPLVAQGPEGWMVRIDRSQNAADPDDTPNLKFMTMGKGFHVIGGPAGTFWHPKNTATGSYTAKANFTLMEPSGHVNYYGLIIGGQNLDGPNQNYIYFLVGQNGTYVIRHRAGEEVHDIQGRTKHEAINQPGQDGRSTNALEVRVMGDKIAYVANGTVVHTTPKSGMTAQTDGVVGVRINHLLNVHVEGFEIQKG